MGNKHDVLMKTAKIWGNESKCIRNKVGAVISKGGRILATGFNGTLPNEDNCCEDENGKTKLTVAHAEHNAILFCAKHGIATNNCCLYITLSPCVECSKLIINAGIKEVYYEEEYRCTDGIELLKKFNIKVNKI